VTLSAQTVLCGIELGGTKCICLLGNARGEIHVQSTLPTGRDPQVTLARIEAILEEWEIAYGPLAALGIASFGPLELRRDAAQYGCVGNSSKPGWAYIDLVGYFARRFRGPIGLTTDVIAAALAEARWGAARDLSDFAYVTVGTGIGVGVIASGKPLIGRHHPELGHARAQRLPGDTWPGICSFHGDCIEGVASGPAIQARSGASAGTLRADHPVWEPVAHALGQLAHTLVVGFGPERILVGGGVACAQAHLFPRVRKHLTESLNGYLEIDTVEGGLESFIVPPGLGDLAGPLGALAVAADAYATGPHIAIGANNALLPPAQMI
jgi:fructokinase